MSVKTQNRPMTVLERLVLPHILLLVDEAARGDAAVNQEETLRSHREIEDAGDLDAGSTTSTT